LKHALISHPAPPRASDICSLLLRCPQVFFEADVVPLKKPPNRAAAAGDPSLAHGSHDLIQRQIRLLGNQRQQPSPMFLHRRHAPPRSACAQRCRFHANAPWKTPTISKSNSNGCYRLARGGFDLAATGKSECSWQCVQFREKAPMEKAMFSVRTKAAPAAAKARGVKLGGPKLKAISDGH